MKVDRARALGEFAQINRMNAEIKASLQSNAPPWAPGPEDLQFILDLLTSKSAALQKALIGRQPKPKGG